MAIKVDLVDLFSVERKALLQSLRLTMFGCLRLGEQKDDDGHLLDLCCVACTS